MNSKLWIGAILLSQFLFGCKKEEGPGGKSSIKGTVVVRAYDAEFTTLQYEQTAKAEDVYIQYGSSNYLGDNAKTNNNGNYIFEYLQPGDYSVYIYSIDSASGYVNSKITAEKKIHLGKSDSEVDAGTLVKYKILDVDQGSASINGKVFQINYTTNFFFLRDTTMAQELEVYLVYGNHAGYDIRVRTAYDGTFEFAGLIKGKYKVYVLSKDKNGGIQYLTRFQQVEISNLTQKIKLNDFFIDKD